MIRKTKPKKINPSRQKEMNEIRAKQRKQEPKVKYRHYGKWLEEEEYESEEDWVKFDYKSPVS